MRLRTPFPCVRPVFACSLLLYAALYGALHAWADNGVVPKPPVARIEPHKLVSHGNTRIDNYYWMRDEGRADREVMGYLRAENDYLKAVLAHTERAQQELYEELSERIAPDDVSVPYRLGEYWYAERYAAEKDHPIYVRRHGGPEGKEEVILDANVCARGHEFYKVGNAEVSEDGYLLAFAEDTVGREIFTLRIKDLRTGALLDDRIEGAALSLAWANDNRTLYYLRLDEALRPYQVFRHRLGDRSENDQLVYEEAENQYGMSLYKSRSREYVLVQLVTTLSTETRLIDAADPDALSRAFLPREPEHRYWVEPKGDSAWVRSNWNAPNYRLLRAPLARSADKATWTEIVPHRTDISLDGFAAFDRFLAVEEVHAGILKLRVIAVDGGADYYLDADEAAYTSAIDVNPNMDTDILRYSYTSLATPRTVIDHDMGTRERIERKRDFAGTGFERGDYVTERLNAPARDGTPVPITLLYRKGTRPDGKHPLYVQGYGAYGYSYYPEFDRDRLSLVDRGFVFALAHLRGGGEFGRRWYDEGKMLNKKNTFTDFIDVTRFLLKTGWGAPDKVVGFGRSAGGLLIGSVANLSPETFTILVTEVPFVDAVTTMLDETIPLTSFEFDEWGNPKVREHYDYMLSYSPYDQVRSRDYPHMLVSTGLWDARVQYWEPAKWVAKLRANKTNDHRLLFYTDMSAGHAGIAGRYKRLKDTAREYAFIFDLFGIPEKKRGRSD